MRASFVKYALDDQSVDRKRLLLDGLDELIESLRPCVELLLDYENARLIEYTGEDPVNSDDC